MTSTKTKSEAKLSGRKTAIGFLTQSRVLGSVAASGAVASTAVALELSPAVSGVASALGGLVLHNPVALGFVVLFAVGQSLTLGSWTNSGKTAKNGNACVACSRCSSVFSTQQDAERHSQGYHV